MHRSTVLSILDILLIAERLDAMSAKGLESGLLGTLPKKEQTYFKAAVSEEYSHAELLMHLGAGAPNKAFYFPPGTFDSLGQYLKVLLSLEEAGISAYSAAIYQFAASRMAEQRLALIGARILRIEAEHRVLVRDVQDESPPHNLCFEVITSTSVRENAKVLRPFLTPDQFSGESTGPVFFPSEESVESLAGSDYCRNPSGVVLMRQDCD